MFHEIKLGVLGAGQLGKMLAEAASPWSFRLYGLDPDPHAPARDLYCSFTCGDFRDFQTVLDFGRKMDIITIEIEHVNTEALEILEKEGVQVHPCSKAITTIKDKGLQKEFYKNQNIPTSPFILIDNRKEIITLVHSGQLEFPFVQKSRTAGYDGKGVKIISTPEDLLEAFDTPSIIEQKANIDKELAIIVSRNIKGETASFPVVEMLFNEKANLVENLLFPANISEDIKIQCQQIATKIINGLDMCGILAVEFFLQKDGSLWVNESAPRPHNSGHYTIEACTTSQYQQHLRAILGLPLGNTSAIVPYSMMINILGEDGYSGLPHYEGISEVLEIESTFLHIYGKKETKPYRKMGHINIIGSSLDSIQKKAIIISEKFKVTSK
jgi:5-(carboxyamino)imidazole ribonucleotide synthase